MRTYGVLYYLFSVIGIAGLGFMGWRCGSYLSSIRRGYGHSICALVTISRFIILPTLSFDSILTTVEFGVCAVESGLLLVRMESECNRESSGVRTDSEVR